MQILAVFVKLLTLLRRYQTMNTSKFVDWQSFTLIVCVKEDLTDMQESQEVSVHVQQHRYN